MAAAASSSSSSSNSSSAGTSSFSKPYIRHQEVGSGRHSKVYRAVEVGTKSILAVKVFDKPASFAEDIRRRHAIKNELKMLEAVRNGPHIIVTGTARYLDDFARNVELPMLLYAEDLTALMNRTNKEERGIWDAQLVVPVYYSTVLAQMLKALEFLHSQNVNIIHRNIKPQNILSRYSGMEPTKYPDHFVLGHFGHASRASPPPTGHTESLEYMAPEMYTGQKQTTAVDIWGLGMVCIEMAGWLPDTDETRTFDSMKQSSWCSAMQILAAELKKSRPEIEDMVRVDALKRPSATRLLTKISSSIQSEGQKASPRLARLMIRKNIGPGVPELHIDTIVHTYCARHGLVYESELTSPTGKASSRTQKAVIARKPRSTPLQLPPCLQGATGLPRRKPLSSAPTTRPLTGPRRMMGPLKSAVLPPPSGSQRIAAPTNSGAISLLTMSKGVADSSAVAPNSTGSEAEEASTRTIVKPQPSRSQEVGKTSKLTGSPKRSQGKGAARESSVSPRPAQNPTNEGPSRPATTVSESQSTIKPAITTSRSGNVRPRETEHSPRATARPKSSPPQEAERLSRSVGIQNPSTPERTHGAPGAAKTSVPTQSQGTTPPSKSASRSNLEPGSPNSQREAACQRGVSTTPHASSSTQLQPNKVPAASQPCDTNKSTDTQMSTSSSSAQSSTHSQGQSASGPSKTSKRLSANAPDFFPPGFTGNERGQALRANIGQPSRHSESQGQKTDVRARLPIHQASRPTRHGGDRSIRRSAILPAHQGAQSSPTSSLARRSPPLSPLNRANRPYQSLGQPGLPPPVPSFHSEPRYQPDHTQARSQYRPPPLHSSAQTSPDWNNAGIFTDLSPTLVGAPAQNYLVYAQVGECNLPRPLPHVQPDYSGHPSEFIPAQHYYYSQANAHGAQAFSYVPPTSQPPRYQASRGQEAVNHAGWFPTGHAEVQGQSTEVQSRSSPLAHIGAQNHGAEARAGPPTSRHPETQSQQERISEAGSSSQLPALPVHRDNSPQILPSPSHTDARTQPGSPQRLTSASQSESHARTIEEDEAGWEKPRQVRRRRSRKASRGPA